MRTIDIALTSLALRASQTRAPEHERELVPSQDDASQATLDRAAISHQRAALVASLWPGPTRQCVTPAEYRMLPAPAAFGQVYRLSWPAPPSADARTLQRRLSRAYPGA